MISFINFANTYLHSQTFKHQHYGNDNISNRGDSGYNSRY